MAKKKHNQNEKQEIKKNTHEQEKKEHQKAQKHGKKCCFKETRTWQILAGVFLVAFAVTLIFALTSNSANNKIPNEVDETCTVSPTNNALGDLQIIDGNIVAQDMIDFMKTYMVQPGTEISLNNISLENGQYKINVIVGDEPIDVYASLDGVLLSVPGLGTINIPEALQRITEAMAQQEAEQNDLQQNLQKSDKPKVELFVMAYCPYGTQFEKGILPVLETLGDKIDFQLKYVYYSMHGTKESAEELNQYCINQKNPELLIPYLSCFLEKDTDTQSQDCMNKLGINTTEIQDCVLQTDKDYNILNNYNLINGYPAFPIYNTENQLYGVEGSPTLVVNETKVNTERDPQSILNIICNAFNDAPSECYTNLSTVNPSPGFGYTTSGNTASNGSC